MKRSGRLEVKLALEIATQIAAGEILRVFGEDRDEEVTETLNAKLDDARIRSSGIKQSNTLLDQQDTEQF